MAKEYTPASRNREAFAAMTDTPGNVPPQAVELEEAVLGALMLEKDSIITVQEFIMPRFPYRRASDHLPRDRGALDRAQTDRPLYGHRAAEGPQGVAEGGRCVVPGAAHAEGGLGGQRGVPRQNHCPEKYVQRGAEPLRDRDPAPFVRRIDRRDGVDRLCRERNLQGGRRSRQAFGTVVQGFAGQGADADRGGIQEHVGLQRRAFGFHGHRPRDARLAVVGPHHRSGTPFDG